MAPFPVVSQRVINILAFSSILLLLLVCIVTSDLAKDREECADKLISLAGCIPYVGGEAKSPTIDCCSGLKVVLENSTKCICILIKDRDDPNLGLKINATLAMQLPSACNTPANISKCVDLLHLAHNSPEAKVFEGFGKSTKTNTSTPVSSGGANKGPDSSAKEKSDGGRRYCWLVTNVSFGILPFLFISHFFFHV